MLRRKCLAAVMLVICILTAVLPAFAEDLEDQLRSYQQKQQEAKQQKQQAQGRVDSFSEQVRKAQTEVMAAEAKYKEIKGELSDTEEKITVNTEVLAQAEKNLAQRNQILNKRFRDIYENGQVNYLEVLFGASDFSDFANRMHLLKRIAQQDIELVNKVKTERQFILNKRAELEAQKVLIVQKKQEAEAAKQQLELKRRESQNLLDKALNDRDTAEKAEREMQAASEQILQMIRQYQSKNYGGNGVIGTGTLSWPLRGPITSEFGGRIHPIFGTFKGHTGIDIGADYGDPVRAADSGVVITAEWISGYGNTVIIDHGNGITTLYGHNQSLLVGEGQRVSKGQQIAAAGSTGNSTGPHVHFEVRQHGTPVNPLNYL